MRNLLLCTFLLLSSLLFPQSLTLSGGNEATGLYAEIQTTPGNTIIVELAHYADGSVAGKSAYWAGRFEHDLDAVEPLVIMPYPRQSEEREALEALLCALNTMREDPRNVQSYNDATWAVFAFVQSGDVITTVTGTSPKKLN